MPTISIILAGRYSNEPDPREVSRELVPNILILFILLDIFADNGFIILGIKEVSENHAWDPRRTNSCISTSDNSWLQWPLEECHQVSIFFQFLFSLFQITSLLVKELSI